MITVKLFGITRDIIGRSSIELNDNIKTTKELLMTLKKQYPELEKLTSLLVAVDNEYADQPRAIKSGQEIALIPPVAGG